jgi:hypothetical protein
MKQSIFWVLMVLCSLQELLVPALAAPPATLEREPAIKKSAGKKPAGRQFPPGNQWVRIKRDQQGEPLAMQTAIVRYVPREAVGDPSIAHATVDLIGAVHIGDRAYYRGLNRRFRQYDALLYELVAPEGTHVPRGHGTSNSNPLGAIQNAMKNMLEVEHQLEQIDYTRPNFVHADLSPQEFMESMEKRDEGFMQMYFQMLGQSIAQQSQQSAQGESADIDFFSALFAKDRARQLKIAMAKQFGSMEAFLAGLSGPDGSTLITERNKRALQVLRQQLTEGKHNLAVFYGAGHLTDMHQQLAEQFDFVPVEITWIDAWNLRGQ